MTPKRLPIPKRAASEFYMWRKRAVCNHCYCETDEYRGADCYENVSHTRLHCHVCGERIPTSGQLLS